MQIETIQMDKEEAKMKYREYLEAEMKSTDLAYGELKTIYGKLAQGKKLVDVPKAIVAAGWNDSGDPRLAIAPANSANGYCIKSYDGPYNLPRDYLEFSGTENGWRRYSESRRLKVSGVLHPRDVNKNILGQRLKAPMPLVPAEVVNKLKHNELQNPNYWVLWEVEKWEAVAPKDPLLLRRLTKNLFIIINKWNLTKLERMVAQGKLG